MRGAGPGQALVQPVHCPRRDAQRRRRPDHQAAPHDFEFVGREVGCAAELCHVGQNWGAHTLR